MISSVRLFAIPWTAAFQASLSFTISWNLLKLVSIELVMPSHPLLPPSPLALSLSQHQGLFQWVVSSHQVPKYWSFSFSISPSDEYLGLISFRMDWLDLLAVQGTLKSLLCLHGRVEDSGAGRQAVKGMVLLQLVSQGCCNKCHKLGGFEQQKFLLA